MRLNLSLNNLLNKQIIYSIVTDGTFDKLAKLFFCSLRKLGKFQGRIICYSDRPRDYSIWDVENRVIPNCVTGYNNRKWIWSYKIHCGRELLHELFDRIAYCDVDMLAIRDVRPLFSLKKMAVVADSTLKDHLASKTNIKGYYGGYLNMQERKIMKYYLSGCFFSCGRKDFESLLDRWNDILQNKPYHGFSDFKEQNAYNAALFSMVNPRSAVSPHWVLANVPMDMVETSKFPEDVRLVHFAASRKSYMESAFSRIVS